MDHIQIEVGGKLLTFSVRFEDDFDAGAPWEVSDCHGPVSEWTTRDKRPTELILNLSSWRGRKRYYDFAEACKIALRDGWDCQSNKPDSAETPRQRAERAARADYEYLQAWCNDEWRYVGVIVTLLDDDGRETEVMDSVWAVETYHDFHLETAKQLADELAHGMGTRWEEVTVKTYKPIESRHAQHIPETKG